jgi:dolichyl-phosphate beta-glucosyltransferase
VTRPPTLAGPRVTLVLPAYNEAARLEGALDELFGYLDDVPQLAECVDVLLVDDGSTDGTVDIAARRPEAEPRGATPPRLTTVSVPHAGKGSAVRAGMLAATGDRVIFADADMATPPPLRRVLGRLFHLLAAVWVTGPIRDTQCGFKGFRREAAQDLFGRQKVTSIVFDVEIIYLARKRDYRIEVVPIHWADKRGSRMRARLGLAVRVAWDLFRIPLIHRRARRRLPSAKPGGAE